MNEAEAEGSESISSTGPGIWIVLVVIIASWGAYWICATPFIKEDKFDPLNTLFSGLAFWGVIYAILLQKSELALQRNELKLTRGEVHGQRLQLEAQNLTLKQQRFENTFFSLLNLFIGIIDLMELRGGRDTTIRGRACFTDLYADFRREYAQAQKTTKSSDSKALCMQAYGKFADYRQTAVGHYFRTLYNIVKFIDKSQIENKQTYINILRAQLSSAELNLLFYNCLSEYGNRKFKPYVEQFGLLENMMLSELLEHSHKNLYKESAFKSPL